MRDDNGVMQDVKQSLKSKIPREKGVPMIGEGPIEKTREIFQKGSRTVSLSQP